MTKVLYNVMGQNPHDLQDIKMMLYLKYSKHNLAKEAFDKLDLINVKF